MGMLILTLGVTGGDEAVITTPAGDEIVVRAVEAPTMYAGKVRVGIEAPRFISVKRRPRTTGRRKVVKVAGEAGLVAAIKAGGGK